MKRIILSSVLFFLTVCAFAQTVEEKATFLTNQMNVLLSLSNEQKAQVNETNLFRFEIEASEKYTEVNLMRQLDLQAPIFQTEKAQAKITQLTTLVTKVENRYDNRLSTTLTADQYALFLQNKQALLASVVSEFGK